MSLFSFPCAVETSSTFLYNYSAMFCFSNPDRIREFIRAVYVDKKYAGGKSTDKPVNDSEVMSL